jgi:hypothetical protein
MTRSIITYCVIAVTILPACTISKNSTDNSAIKHVTKNIQKVKEAAEFAVSVTLKESKKEFDATDVQDENMRKKILSLGSIVEVSYNNGSSYEIPDSNVTFKTITLFGVTEVIYDFAAAPRHFNDNTSNRKGYYFVKVAERIYYRRRQIPMM